MPYANPEVRLKKAREYQAKYRSDPEKGPKYRAVAAAAANRRYATDPTKIKAKNKRRVDRIKNDPDRLAKKRAYQAAYMRERMKDPVLRAAAKDATRKWREKNGPGYLLLQRFGISLAQYNEMLTTQNGTCAICKRPETVTDHRTKKPKRLAVDHDAVTGRVRGLLCNRCNPAIGLLGHDADILQAAIDYLKDN